MRLYMRQVPASFDFFFAEPAGGVSGCGAVPAISKQSQNTMEREKHHVF